MVRAALGASLAISASPAVSADPASFVVAFAAMGGLQLLYGRTPLAPACDPAAGSRLPRLREIRASALDYSAATLAIIPANGGGRMMFWPRG